MHRNRCDFDAIDALIQWHDDGGADDDNDDDDKIFAIAAISNIYLLVYIRKSSSHEWKSRDATNI